MIRVKIDVPKTGKSFTTLLDEQTQISAHFRLVELANNKGNIILPQYEINAATGQFMTNIEELREWWGKPMNVSSCYRQVAFNKSIGGSSNSLHLQGLALDWKVKLNDKQRDDIIHKWSVISYQSGHVPGVNIYSNGLHLSYDESLLGYKTAQLRDYRNTIKDW